MQDSQGLSRIERLKERYFHTPPAICSERARIITQAYKDLEGYPIGVKRAKSLERILTQMSIFIGEDELIVGNQASKPRSSPIFPEFSFDWIVLEMDREPFEKREADRFLIDERTKEDLRGLVDFWKGRTVNDLTIAALPEETFETIKNSAVYTFGPEVVVCSGVGHYSPHYQKILEKGFAGIKAEAQHKLEAMGIPSDGREVEQYNFWKSIGIACDAVMAFAKRYADLARDLAAKETDPVRKADLETIAAVCAKVPAQPATTFQEACQSFYFFQLVLQIESSGHSISPGRFDQYMHPYFKADIKAGRLGEDQAQELIECLWIKLSEINKVRPIGATKAFGGYPMFQNLCVGGQTREGKDATNRLSFMCLDASQNVRLHQPSISARLWNGTPYPLWKKIVEVTKKGLGMPALYNDEVIIPALLNRGKTIEDARAYAIVGCVEPGPQGYEYGWSGGTGDAPFFSMPACLEYAINDGKSLITGAQAGPKTGSLAESTRFDDVQAAYEKQVQYFVDQFAVITNTADLIHQQACPLPVLSCGMEPCVERGLDVTAGGAKYNATGTAGVGVSNTGDSLMSIKEYVFDKRKISGADLLRTLRSDWEGQEVLRNEILAKVQHYGNDLIEADEMAAWAAEVYCKRTERSIGTRGRYSPGLYPVSANLPMGLGVGASADGRKRGQPLADGISPVHGRDVNGPTALLNSASRIDHLINSNGTLLNLRFHPSALAGEVGEAALIAALKSYFENKGMHVQYNVVSIQKLRDAQKNPDKYRDLVVRVAGYSALFVGLDPDLQEDIITRTEFEQVSAGCGCGA
jgi:formate C-acetyltransferase